MINLKIDISKVLDFVSLDEIQFFHKEIKEHYDALYHKTGKGHEFLGWINLPSDFPENIIKRIEQDAKSIREKAEIFVVIGIGGSYLGAKAVNEALDHNFSNLLQKRKYPLILYAGQNISENYLANLLDILEEKEYAIAIISKSGTTTEPAIAFRLIKNHLENRYGKQKARQRIFAITDKSKGALKQLANEEHYSTYVVPDNVGGRYSVLTPVGLLPVAVAGHNIRKLLEGAATMQKYVRKNTNNFNENPVSLYAATRNALYRNNKIIEIMVNYEPELYFFIEWWKQLFGESEGKEKKGIFPAGVNFTTDLHSMGQYIQDGMRNIFETVISVEDPNKELYIPFEKKNLDKLNYLAGKRIHEVNRMAELGTILAHVDGGVPNIRISLPEISEFNLGQMIYFFEMACAVSGYILGINPFDQPGVETYKKNMFALLGKPGFEK